MAFWLVKSEPDVYSIDDLRRDRVTHWHGVRNYQARNNLRAMRRGDQVLFYASVIDPVGIAGLAEVHKEAYPDPSQFERKSEYYDPKARQEAPRWFCPDLVFVQKFPAVLETKAIREMSGLKGLALLQKGSRLSVQPVSAAHFEILLRAARGGR